MEHRFASGQDRFLICKRNSNIITKNDKIYIAEPMKIDMNMIQYKLKELRNLLQNYNNEQKDEIKRVIKEIVPTFKEQK